MPVAGSLQDDYGDTVAGVQVGSGNVVERVTESSLTVAGPTLAFDRSYNSLDATSGPFGLGWSSSFEASLTELASGSVDVLDSSGRVDSFTPDGVGGYRGAGGYSLRLFKDAGVGWRVQDVDRGVRRFDLQGRLAERKDRYGRSQTLSYDAGGQLTEVRDMGSNRFFALTWAAGRVTQVSTSNVTRTGTTAPLVWRLSYTGSVLTKVCDPRYPVPTGEKCTVYAYDASNRLTQITTPDGKLRFRTTYGTTGKASWSKDAMGAQHTFSYGGASTRVTDPLARVWTYGFDGRYRTARVVDPAGGATTYGYDGGGYRALTISPMGFGTGITRNDRGLPAGVIDAEGATTWYAYDANGFLTDTRDPRSLSASDNNFRTVRTNNIVGDPMSETSPATSEAPSGITKSYSYTASGEDHGWGVVPVGLPATASDGDGVVTFRYDIDGDLRRRIEPSGRIVEYDHDELGAVTATRTIADGTTAEVTTSLDRAGNEIDRLEPAITNPITGMMHRQRVTSVVNPDGRTAQMTVADVGGSATPDPPRVVSSTFDNAGRETTRTRPDGGVITTAYDLFGNVSSTTDPLGRTVLRTYDNRNRLITESISNLVDDPAQPTQSRALQLVSYAYDADGRTTAETRPATGTGPATFLSPSGSATTTTVYGYDKTGRLLTTTLVGFGRRDGTRSDVVLERRVLDAAGNLVTLERNDGAERTTFTVDQMSRTQQAREYIASPEDERFTNMDYDASGDQTRISRADSYGTVASERRTTFDPAGRPTSVTTENGATDLISYTLWNQRDIPTADLDARSSGVGDNAFRTDYTYDAVGRLISTVSPPVTTESLSAPTPVTTRATVTSGFDTFGNPTHRTDPAGALTTTTFDLLNRATRTDLPSIVNPAGATVTAYESTGFDLAGNAVQRRARDGGVTDYGYDSLRRLVSVTEPLVTGQPSRGVFRNVYDDASNVVRTVDQAGAITTSTFDDLGRPRSFAQVVRQVSGSPTYTTQFDYDLAGRMVLRDDPTGVTRSWTYNAAGSLKREINDVGEFTDHRYDAAGRETATTDWLNRTTATVYDLAGRPTVSQRRVGWNGTVLSNRYATFDQVGNQIEQRDGRSATPADTTFLGTRSYDSRNAVRTVTQPTGAAGATTSEVTTFGYDSSGLVSRLTDSRGNTTLYQNNSWGLTDTVVEPATTAQPALSDRSWKTGFDVAGRPVSEAQPGGVSVTRGYDEIGRVVSESGSGGGSVSASITKQYDVLGRLSGFSSSAGQVGVSWDDRGLLVGVDVPGTAVGDSMFGYDGAGRMTSRVDAAGSSSYTYDSNGWLDVSTDPVSGMSTDFARNATGQITSSVTSGGSVQLRRDVTYDSFGRATLDATKVQGGATLSSSAWGFDVDGRLISRVVTGGAAAGSESYTYDRQGRLSSWVRPSGQVVPYRFDGSGNLTEGSTGVSTFDERNRVRSDGSGRTFTWSPRSTLSSVTQAGVPASVAVDGLGRLVAHGGVTYTVDALGRVESRTSAGVSQTSYFSGLGLDPVAVGSDRWSSFPDGSISGVSVGGVSGTGVSDRHGDLTGVVSGAGVLVGSRGYGPFGEPGSSSGPVGVRGFQGDTTDPTTGLVNMGARWMDPTVGSFVSRDVVRGAEGRPGGWNRFAYAQGDPLGRTDLDGRWPGFIDDAAGWVNDNVIAPVVDTGKKVIATVSTALSSGYNSVKSVATKAYRGAQRFVATGVRALGRVASSAGSGLKSAWKTTAKAVGSVVRQAKAAVSSCVKSQLCRQIVGVAVISIAMVVAPVLLPTIGLGMGLGAGLGVATCGGDTNCIVNSTIVGGLSGAVPLGGATTVLGRIGMAGVVGSVSASSNEFLATGTVSPRTVATGFATGALFGGVAEGTSAFFARRATATLTAETNLATSRLGATEAGSASASTIDEAISGLSAGRSGGVRTVGSAGELDDLFTQMSRGGEVIENAYPGKLVRLPDGTTVGLRGASKSGGPTIDIVKPGTAPIKVHVGP